MPQCIYYIPLDTELNEAGPPIPITLNADGTADVSKLPQNLQERLSVFGIPNSTHTNSLFPKDGESFLECLPDISNLYMRFREHSESRASL